MSIIKSDPKGLLHQTNQEVNSVDLTPKPFLKRNCKVQGVALTPKPDAEQRPQIAEESLEDQSLTVSL